MNVDVVLDAIKPMGEGAFMNSGILSVEINSSNLKRLNESESVFMGIFSDCSSLKSFKVSNNCTLQGIDALSFNRCTALTDVVLSDKITSIGESAFDGCTSLLNINIPNGVSIIEEGTFKGCENLKTLQLPEGVMKINNNAFYGCTSLEKINTPENLMAIRQKVFFITVRIYYNLIFLLTSPQWDTMFSKVEAASRKFCFLQNWIGHLWNIMSLTAVLIWRRCLCLTGSLL